MAATTVQQTECLCLASSLDLYIERLRFLNTPFLITDPTERFTLVGGTRSFPSIQASVQWAPWTANHGNTQIFNPADKCVVDSAPVQRILFPRERDEGQQAEQAYRDFPCQRSGFLERWKTETQKAGGALLVSDTG